MDRETLELINQTRLEGWRKRCNDMYGTPVMMLTVGHGPKNGEIGIIVTEDCQKEAITAYLLYALQQLSPEYFKPEKKHFNKRFR